MRAGNVIYLDHQATTPVDEGVLEAMLPYFRDSFGNPHSTSHCLGWAAHAAVENAAAQVAQLLGADADEILFTSGATEANNLALLGIGRRNAGGKRNRILLNATEHKSVLSIGEVLGSRHGFKVEQVPVDRTGMVDLSVLESRLDNDVLAVSVMAVNNEVGAIQELEKISGLARKRDAIFHCDASQAPLAMDTGMLAAHADVISLSAHKMYGPKGIGALYVARELRDGIEPVIHGGGQQYGLRSGTTPVPLCVGMGAAAEFITSHGVEKRRAEMRRRRDGFVEKLCALERPLAINGPAGEARHPGNANVCFEGFSGDDILDRLQPRLAASTGSACSSGIPEPSHVLRAMGLDYGRAAASIRFSLGLHTSDSDIEEAADLIGDALAALSASHGRSAPSVAWAG